MKHYLETRNITITSNASIAADLAQHLVTRQHLGKAIVICDRPVMNISIMRKFWLRQARSVQRERASTLNAERILQLTHDITRMQRMEFVARQYCDSPASDVFFVTPDQLDEIPASCYSAYIINAPSTVQLANVINQMPHRSLVVDYSNDPAIHGLPLLPKSQLEQQVPEQWSDLELFFRQHGINIQQLIERRYPTHNIDLEIDSILDSGNYFLGLAGDFLELLRLAQPTDIPNNQQRQYELVATLYRKVSALTPGLLSQQFVKSLGDEDSSFSDMAAATWSWLYEDSFAQNQQQLLLVTA